MKVSKFDLISGKRTIPLPFCSVRVPILGDIREIGLEIYEQYLHVFSLGLNYFLKEAGIEEKYACMSDDEKKIFTPFNFLIAYPDTRDLLMRGLSFFITEEIQYDEKNAGVLVLSDGVDSETKGIIRSDEYEELRDIILQVSNIKNSSPAVKKFKSNKAREIYMKIMKGREESQKRGSSDPSLNIGNMIASVSAYHPSYNLINIWRLTIYQLYDQFSRLNVKAQVDIVGTRWAVWGKDPFDFTFWYKENDKGE